MSATTFLRRRNYAGDTCKNEEFPAATFGKAFCIFRYLGVAKNTTDSNAVKGYYRKKKELNILLDNQPLYIGTSSGSMDKLLYTRYLCDFMGIESGQIIWYDKEEKVFSN